MQIQQHPAETQIQTIIEIMKTPVEQDLTTLPDYHGRCAKKYYSGTGQSYNREALPESSGKISMKVHAPACFGFTTRSVSPLFQEPRPASLRTVPNHRLSAP